MPEYRKECLQVIRFGITVLMDNDVPKEITIVRFGTAFGYISMAMMTETISAEEYLHLFNLILRIRNKIENEY